MITSSKKPKKYKINKIKFLNIIYKSLMSLAIISSFLIGFFINWGIAIIIFSAYTLLIIFIYFMKIKLDNRTIRALNKQFKDVKGESVIKVYDTDFILKLIDQKVSESSFSISNYESFMDFIFIHNINDRTELFLRFKENFAHKLSELLNIIINFLDNQDYELIKFLSIKKKKHYTIWMIIELIVIFIFVIIVFNIIYAIYPLQLLIIILIIFLIPIAVPDIISYTNKTFNSGYFRFRLNKNLLENYLRWTNLILNCCYIHSIPNFRELRINIDFLNKRFRDYCNLITPIYAILKKYEIIPIMGIIFSIIIVLFQNYLSEIFVLFSNLSIIRLIFLIFIFIILYLSIILIFRFNKIIIMKENIYNKTFTSLDTNFKILKMYHYAFINYNSDK